MARTVTTSLAFTVTYDNDEWDQDFDSMSDAEFREFVVEDFWSILAENVNEDLPLVVEISV